MAKKQRTIFSELGKKNDRVSIKLTSLNNKKEDRTLVESAKLNWPLKTGKQVNCDSRVAIKEKVVSIKYKDGEPKGELFEIETANAVYEITFL